MAGPAGQERLVEVELCLPVTVARSQYMLCLMGLFHGKGQKPLPAVWAGKGVRGSVEGGLQSGKGGS